MAQTLRSRVLRDHGMERAGGRERLAAHGCMSCGKAVSGNKRICLDCAAAQYQNALFNKTGMSCDRKDAKRIIRESGYADAYSAAFQEHPIDMPFPGLGRDADRPA